MFFATKFWTRRFQNRPKGASLQGLTVQGEIQSCALVFVAYTQRHEQIDDLKKHKCNDARPSQRHADPIELNQDLVGVAIERTRGLADGGDSEYASQKCSGRA